MESFDIALLVLRVWAGVVMLAHGINHGRSLEGTARWFARVGFKAPRLNAFLSASMEVTVGLALMAGLLTPVVAAAMLATMLVAFWSIHRFAGFFVFHRPDEGYEYVLTLAVVGLVLALLGPGPMSIDAALGLDESLTGAVGAGIYGLGVLAAAGQLVTFWRRPAGGPGDGEAVAS